MEDWLLILLITGEMIFDAVIVAWLSGKWAFKMFMRGVTHPDDNVKRAVASLVTQLIVCPVATGRTVKDADGIDVPESKPLFAFMGREMFRQFELYLRAKSGGDQTGLGKIAGSDPDLAAMMAGSGRLVGIRKKRKDEGIVEYLTEIVATSPQGQEAIGKIMSSKLGEMGLIPK